MWWMLAACSKSDTAVIVVPADTGDVGSHSEPPDTDDLVETEDPPAPPDRIVSFETTCASLVWHVDVVTSSPVTEVRVLFDQTGVTSPWFEDHVLESDASGMTWSASLDHVSTPSEVVSGETSLYSCDDVQPGRYDTITFVSFAYDGDELLHCVVFGDEPLKYPDCDDGSTW